MQDDFGFMYLATTKQGAENKQNALKVPFPNSPADFESERAFDGQRNANNVLVGTWVGRDVDKQNCVWDLIDADTWWNMNRFIRVNPFFWCHYFSYTYGEWHTRKFYAGNPKTGVKLIDKKTGLPTSKFSSCSRNFIDTGEGD